MEAKLVTLKEYLELGHKFEELDPSKITVVYSERDRVKTVASISFVETRPNGGDIYNVEFSNPRDRSCNYHEKFIRITN